MLVDSHCHLHHLDLTAFNQDLGQVLALADKEGVGHMLCVSVDLKEYSILKQYAKDYDKVSISVGVHPTEEVEEEPTSAYLCQLAAFEKCIALGETGLDFYRTTEQVLQEKQKNRFRAHIQAALSIKKPLIIHTRQAPQETIQVMEEEGASDIGGVMHCFSESWEMAKQALDLHFYISLSGIVTFKNATNIQDLAKKVPLDRLLIETDAPYLAPVPFRGKQNHPALVKYVAMEIARLRGIDFEEVATKTTKNFYDCFRVECVK